MTQENLETKTEQQQTSKSVLAETIKQPVDQDELNTQQDWVRFMGSEIENLPDLPQQDETNTPVKDNISLEQEAHSLEIQAGLSSPTDEVVESLNGEGEDKIDLADIEQNAGYLSQKAVEFLLPSQEDSQQFLTPQSDNHQQDNAPLSDEEKKSQSQDSLESQNTLETQKSVLEPLSVEVQQNTYLDPDAEQGELFRQSPEPQDAELPYDKSKRCNCDLMLKDYPKTFDELAKKLNKPVTKITPRDLPQKYVSYHEGDYSPFSLYKTLVDDTTTQSDKSSKQTYTLTLTATGKVLAQDIVDVIQNNHLGLIWVQHKNNRYSLFGVDGTPICDKRKKFRFIESTFLTQKGLTITFYGGKKIEYESDFQKSHPVSVPDDFDKDNDDIQPKSHILRNTLISFFALGTALSTYVGATHICPQLPKVEEVLPNVDLKKVQEMLKKMHLSQMMNKKEVLSVIRATLQQDVQHYQKNLELSYNNRIAKHILSRLNLNNNQKSNLLNKENILCKDQITR